MTDDDLAYPRGPGHRVSRGPVVEAYAETQALEHRCPNCKAEIGSYCAWPDGGFRKIACPDRVPHNPDPEAAR